MEQHSVAAPLIKIILPWKCVVANYTACKNHHSIIISSKIFPSMRGDSRLYIKSIFFVLKEQRGLCCQIPPFISTLGLSFALYSEQGRKLKKGIKGARHITFRFAPGDVVGIADAPGPCGPPLALLGALYARFDGPGQTTTNTLAILGSLYYNKSTRHTEA